MDTAKKRKGHGKITSNRLVSMLLGIFFIVLGISRRKQKGWPIILIALGIVFVLIAVYLGLPK
jgi:Kef-type K+ transport system membrane component KefB